MGSGAYFEVYTVVMFKYDDFQKASRISLRGPSISINSIDASITEGSNILKSVDSNEISTEQQGVSYSCPTSTYKKYVGCVR